MNLNFRELFLDNLPKIKELSNTMGMLNDPKIGNTAEALIKDPKCILYGAFSSIISRIEWIKTENLEFSLG